MNEDLYNEILDLIETTAPDSVETLVEDAQNKYHVSKEVIINKIIELNNEGRLYFHQKNMPIPQNLSSYLFSFHSLWFWLVILLSVTTVLSIVLISEDNFPLVLIRYLLSSTFVFLLPGYCLIRTLYPLKEIDNIERVVLSIVMNLVIVPLVGFLLNFTSWGIRLVPVIATCIFLTLSLGLMGIIREHDYKKHVSQF